MSVTVSAELDRKALHAAHRHQRPSLSHETWKRVLDLSEEDLDGAPDPVSWRVLREHLNK